jgi:hypothetical protein
MVSGGVRFASYATSDKSRLSFVGPLLFLSSFRHSGPSSQWSERREPGEHFLLSSSHSTVHDALHMFHAVLNKRNWPERVELCCGHRADIFPWDELHDSAADLGHNNILIYCLRFYTFIKSSLASSWTCSIQVWDWGISRFSKTKTRLQILFLGDISWSEDRSIAQAITLTVFHNDSNTCTLHFVSFVELASL